MSPADSYKRVAVVQLAYHPAGLFQRRSPREARGERELWIASAPSLGSSEIREQHGFNEVEVSQAWEGEAPSWVRLPLILCLLFLASCATSGASASNGLEARGVSTSPQPKGRVRLSFAPGVLNPDLEVLAVDKAQAALTVFHSALLAERPEILILPPARLRLRLISEARRRAAQHQLCLQRTRPEAGVGRL